MWLRRTLAIPEFSSFLSLTECPCTTHLLRRNAFANHSRSAPTFTTFPSFWLPSLNLTRISCRPTDSVDPQERRPAVGLYLDFPYRVAQWFCASRVPVVRPGRPRLRRQGMPTAWPDVRVAAARQGAPGDPGQGIADQAGRQGNEGTGSLHGRIAAHDDHRFVRHQRYRARHRVAAAPFAWRVLRARPRQDPLVGQAAVLGAYHSLPRFVAGLRVRPERHPVLPRRPPPQDAGDDPAEGHRHVARADPGELLRVRQFQPALRRRGNGIRRRAPAWRSRAFRHRRQVRQDAGR